MRLNNNSLKDLNKGSDLYTDITTAKQKKQSFLKQLKNNINKSQSMIRKSESQLNIKAVPEFKKIIDRKQKSLHQLARSLNERISLDRQASKKLQDMSELEKDKKEEIEKKISQIKKRNQHRAKQLHQFQSKYIRKINEEYKKDKEKEQGLLVQYESVLSKQAKIKQTLKFRKAIQNEDWKAIIKEKEKLEKMIKQFKKKQQILLKEQNPQAMRQLIEQNQIKITIQQEQKQIIQVRKPRVKVDAKQIGNQYLQYAKKLKQAPKQKAKLKILDVNFKCIDYQNSIMNKIARNTSDLSKLKIQQQQAAITTSKQAKSALINNYSSKNLFTAQNKQDQQTRKNLKQIRQNLKILEKQKLKIN